MSGATTTMVAAGERLNVVGTYADVKARLASRTLSADDGAREFKLADGSMATVNRGAVALVLENKATAKGKLGFA